MEWKDRKTSHDIVITEIEIVLGLQNIFDHIVELLTINWYWMPNS